MQYSTCLGVGISLPVNRASDPCRQQPDTKWLPGMIVSSRPVDVRTLDATATCAGLVSVGAIPYWIFDSSH